MTAFTWGDRLPIIDSESRSLVGISWEHFLAHEGYLHSFMHLDTGIANDAKHWMHLKTGTKEIHLSVGFIASTKAYASVYQEPTLSSDGTPIDPQPAANKIGSTAHPLAGFTIYEAPTVTDHGTYMGTVLLGGGSRVSPQGGESRAGGGEWDLPENKSYLILFEGKGGAGITTDVGFVGTLYAEPFE